MNRHSTLLLELIKVSLALKPLMAVEPTTEEWSQLFQMAQDQAVVGVCFVGVQKLKVQRYSIPDDVYFEWLAVAVQIQERNELMNQWTMQLCRKIEKDGYSCCVLKGQSLARLYGQTESAVHTDEDKELASLRQSGDIDIWMLSGHKDVIRWGMKNGGIWYYDYHHADLIGFHDAEVELHYRPTLSRNLWRNARLQRWFRKRAEKLISKNGEFPVSNEVFNLILVLNHNLWHLLYEGVGMRQMMDLYFVLRSLTANHSYKGEENDYLKLIKIFSLEKFAAASMWVMKEVFGLPDNKMICRPNERSGRFLLQEILIAGNFGYSDERLKKGRYGNRVILLFSWMKHNWRLFRYFPSDVLWTPIGVLYISMWRRWHYVVDGIKLDKK